MQKDFFGKCCWSVEHLCGETAPGRDLGQSKPSVSFSRGDYWKSTPLLLWLYFYVYLYLHLYLILLGLVHLWPISDGSSLEGMLKQYNALFQLHISTEIIFTLFLHILLSDEVNTQRLLLPCFYSIYSDEVNTRPTVLMDRLIRWKLCFQNTLETTS